eukprot:Rhum_TRINITY_DN1077_c0_g1::Rhum_TRINITY_DN1077_c0_g1_i1::g.3273::m.3273
MHSCVCSVCRHVFIRDTGSLRTKRLHDGGEARSVRRLAVAVRRTADSPDGQTLEAHLLRKGHAVRRVADVRGRAHGVAVVHPRAGVVGDGDLVVRDAVLVRVRHGVALVVRRRRHHQVDPVQVGDGALDDVLLVARGRAGHVHREVRRGRLALGQKLDELHDAGRVAARLVVHLNADVVRVHQLQRVGGRLRGVRRELRPAVADLAAHQQLHVHALLAQRLDGGGHIRGEHVGVVHQVGGLNEADAGNVHVLRRIVLQVLRPSRGLEALNRVVDEQVKLEDRAGQRRERAGSDQGREGSHFVSSFFA